MSTPTITGHKADTARHNFGTVVAFEFLRTITKRRFWAVSLAVPLLIAIIFGLQSAGAKSDSSQNTAGITFSYLDHSGLVDANLAKAMGGTPTTDAATAVEQVKQGKLDAFLDIPADLPAAPISISAKDAGLMGNGKYGALASALLKVSVAEKIGDKKVAAVAAAGVQSNTTAYLDGTKTAGWGSVVLPGLFLVLFYLAILMLSNQMLNVTLEEKENRVSEMILTTMNPTTLITGKVIALMGVGILQMLVAAVPVVIARIAAPSLVKIPGLAWSDIPIQPGRIAVALLIFIFGFAMYSGCLVALGAVMPTAREAGSAMGVVMITLFIPFYAFGMILNNPSGLVPTIFTYFPLTAPVTALLRNALGALSWLEAGIVLVILAITSVVMLRLGVRLFQTGSISYGSRVNIREALRLSR